MTKCKIDCGCESEIQDAIEKLQPAALKSEPCEDMVSAVMHILTELGYGDEENGADVEYMSALCDVAEKVKALQPITPKQGWIPVSERLPEINKEVIVTDNETSDTYQSRYIGKGYWECDNGIFNNRIIAWMPKPKSYKAESSKTEQGLAHADQEVLASCMG